MTHFIHFVNSSMIRYSNELQMLNDVSVFCNISNDLSIL